MTKLLTDQINLLLFGSNGRSSGSARGKQDPYPTKGPKTEHRKNFHTPEHAADSHVRTTRHERFLLGDYT
ncbi:hypothetical protein TWF506_002713 [Arthrobotrys conoides]|uniref:Uncharacterized protein n=1 Tax=Arthrobotrys conoides TaxID=74498 RepID=A0AAN8RV15_9PEZI